MDVQQFADIEAEFWAAEINTLAYRSHELWHACPGLAHTGLMPGVFHFSAKIGQGVPRPPSDMQKFEMYSSA